MMCVAMMVVILVVVMIVCVGRCAGIGTNFEVFAEGGEG